MKLIKITVVSILVLSCFNKSYVIVDDKYNVNVAGAICERFTRSNVHQRINSETRYICKHPVTEENITKCESMGIKEGNVYYLIYALPHRIGECILDTDKFSSLTNYLEQFNYVGYEDLLAKVKISHLQFEFLYYYPYCIKVLSENGKQFVNTIIEGQTFFAANTRWINGAMSNKKKRFRRRL
jgi:hypothetical protein